jgi:hypothetical protein
LSIDWQALNHHKQKKQTMALSSGDARKRFEAENKIATEDPDHIYKYDEAKHQGWTSQRLWQKEYLLPALSFFSMTSCACRPLVSDAQPQFTCNACINAHF